MKISRTYQKGLSWPAVLFALVLSLVICLIFVPILLRPNHGGHIANTIHNAKIVASALNTFHDEYGNYPCNATRDQLVSKGIDNLPSGDNANAYLAQLIVSSNMDSELFFFTPGIEGVKKGDDIMRPNELLAKGENGFAYIMAENGQSLSAEKAITPLVITPIKRKGSGYVFDPKPYGGKYVYGTVAGNAIQGEIDKNGTPLSKGRAHLFEPGPDSLFGDQIPVIKYPLGF